MGWRDGGVVLVTGGASGLGASVAAGVSAGGGRPIVLDRNPPAAGMQHHLVDLADARAAERAVTAVVGAEAEVSAVVCAAGIDACGALDEVDGAEWDRVVQVNLLGTVAVVRAALPALRRAHGRVVTVASTLGLRALPDATAYCASKFAVVGFTRSLAAELAGAVGVTLLVPGGMQTPFFDGRDERYRPPPDARLNRPEDVAAVVLFALDQPDGCELRELVVCSSTETSWP